MTAHITARANGYNFIIAFFVGLGSFTYGFDSAIVGSVIGLPSFYLYFSFEYTSSYGSSIIGANNGVYAGGSTIGCWIVNWFSDRLGRRLVIQIIAAICILSAALQTGSVHIAMFLVGRFLNGVGVAMINCTVSLFVRYRLAPPITSCFLMARPLRSSERITILHGLN
jgi:MFS family permease